jgi:hypothetical protein
VFALKRSGTQYLFKVDLQRPESELRGVALLGHQTLAALHESISGSIDGEAQASFSFRFGEEEIDGAARLDDLHLRVGQTFEYVLESSAESRRELITLEFIDDE